MLNKKRIVLSLMILFIMINIIACRSENSIHLEVTDAFQIQMKQEHDYISDIRFYTIEGPRSLVLEYIFKDKATNEQIELCFQESKDFILKEDVLQAIQENKGYDFLNITMEMYNGTTRVDFESNYYKPGPDGYQDNRYWTEDYIDNFSTWSSWKSDDK